MGRPGFARDMTTTDNTLVHIVVVRVHLLCSPLGQPIVHRPERLVTSGPYSKIDHCPRLFIKGQPYPSGAGCHRPICSVWPFFFTKVNSSSSSTLCTSRSVGRPGRLLTNLRSQRPTVWCGTPANLPVPRIEFPSDKSLITRSFCSCGRGKPDP